MQWSQLGTLVVIFLTVFGAVGALVSIVTTNPLLLSSAWQLPAVVTLLVCLGVVILGALVGGPPSQWKRTPYW